MQNPHPLIVHFPLALLVVAGVGAFLGAAGRRADVAAFARACLYLGTAAAAVTVLSGFLAAQSVAPVAAARGPLEEHQNYGYVTLALAAALSAWSVVAWRRHDRAPRPTALWLLGNLLLLGALVLTGREGGELVYEHGLGTALTAPGGALHEGGRAPAGAPAGAGLGAPAAGDSVPSARDFR